MKIARHITVMPPPLCLVGLGLGLSTKCKAGTLRLEPHLHSILLWLFGNGVGGSRQLFPWAGLKPQSY
jgi:hypothetical protein